MTSTTPPRKRFQIHLSTAIVMMFVAGTLMFANTHQCQNDPMGEIVLKDRKMTTIKKAYEMEFLRGNLGEQWHGYRYYYWGWPCDAVTSDGQILIGKDGSIDFFEYGHIVWYKFLIIVNSVFALVILAACWFLCEWRIHQRVPA